MFYLILKHSHSGLRWIALFFLLSTVLLSAIRYFGKKEGTGLDKKMGLIALTTLHIQLLLGIILFFISPKVVFSAESMGNALLRFFLLEHSALMILAVVLVTIGYSKAKKAQQASSQHLRLFVFYGLGLLLILVGIPWPWRALGAGWM